MKKVKLFIAILTWGNFAIAQVATELEKYLPPDLQILVLSYLTPEWLEILNVKQNVLHPVAALAISPDNKYIFVGHNRAWVRDKFIKGFINVWKIDGTYVKTIKAPIEFILSLNVIIDQEELYLISNYKIQPWYNKKILVDRQLVLRLDKNLNTSVILYNRNRQKHSQDGKYIINQDISSTAGNSVLSDDNRSLISLNNNGQLTILNRITGQEEFRCQLYQAPEVWSFIYNCYLEVNDNFLLSVAYYNRNEGKDILRIFDIDTKQKLTDKFLNVDNGRVNPSGNKKNFIYTPDGSEILVFDYTEKLIYQIKIIEARRGESNISCLKISADSKYIIVGLKDGTVKLFKNNLLNY